MKPTVGRIVHYYPKQECITPESMEKYAAIITQVNFGIEGSGAVDSVELTTLGPNSIYFQHEVFFSEQPAPGRWSWPVKEN